MKSKLQKFLILSACVLMAGAVAQARNGNRGGCCGAGSAWNGNKTQNTRGGQQLRQCRRQGRQQNDAAQSSCQDRQGRCRQGNGTGVCPYQDGTTGTCTATQNCTGQNCTADDCPRHQARQQQRKRNGSGANKR